MKNNTDKAIQKSIKSFAKKNATMADLLPFRQYKNDCFYTTDGKIIDLMKIVCHDILSMSEDEQSSINYTLEKFFRTYADDIKIVGINLPVDTTSNQRFLQHKIANCNNEIQKSFLQEELSQEECAADILSTREFYLMVFFDTIEKRNKSISDISNTLGEHYIVDTINQAEKEAVLYQLFNQNFCVDIDKLYNINLPANDAIEKYIQAYGYDPYLISRIQPQGGISFKDDKYISTGEGYTCCIHLFDYKNNITDYWLNRVLNYKNVISTVDVATENTEDVKVNLNKAMEEQQDRIDTADNNRNYLEAAHRLAELTELFNEIDSFEEIIKIVHTRIFVSAKTKNEAEQRVADVINSLNSDGYKGTVFLGESKAEWCSLFQSYSEQAKSDHHRYGQAIPSHTLAFGNPFIFSSLNDPYGTYLGTTVNSGGIVNFDPLAITSRRTQYNGLICGGMGAGKSTTLKNMITNLFSLGVIIRGFDIKDEYSELVNQLGGKVIKLDGSQGILNILEILETAQTDYESYTRHISKLKIIYKFFKRTADENEISLFATLLDKLYRNFNLRGDDGEKITGLEPSKYPIMSDLLELVEKEITQPANDTDDVQKGLDLQKRKWLLQIQTTIRDIVNNYGRIFDGHTSISNIFNEQIIFFNIAGLKDAYPPVFAAVVYNAIQLCWDNCIQIQTPIKEQYLNGTLKWEDIQRYLIFIDESNRFINAKNDFALEPITNYMREGRHLFAGIWMATQELADYFDNGTSDAERKSIQTLFNLCQYKLIMKQDSNSTSLISQMFSGQITDYEISLIPRFTKGQGILNISGDKNVVINIDVSDERLNWFKGGA